MEILCILNFEAFDTFGCKSPGFQSKTTMTKYTKYGAALSLPCLTSVKAWISSGWAMRGRIQRRAAVLVSCEAANACKKTAGSFVPCSTASSSQGNTQARSAIQVCLLYLANFF